METRGMAPRSPQVPVIEAKAVQELRELHARGWGSKRIAGELGIARNTVKRYLQSRVAEVQVRPSAQALDVEGRRVAVALFDDEAEGNAVVVAELLRARGYEVSERTVPAGVRRRRTGGASGSRSSVPGVHPCTITRSYRPDHRASPTRAGSGTAHPIDTLGRDGDGGSEEDEVARLPLEAA